MATPRCDCFEKRPRAWKLFEIVECRQLFVLAQEERRRRRRSGKRKRQRRAIHPAESATTRSRLTVFGFESFFREFVPRHRQTVRMMHSTMLDVMIVIWNADYRAQRPRY